MYVDPGVGGLSVLSASSICGVVLIALAGVFGAVLYFLKKRKKN